MPKSKIEQWLADNQAKTSCDYPELVNRIKAGERVECLIETEGGNTLAIAEYVKTGFGMLFKLHLEQHGDPRLYSVEQDFINACADGNVLYLQQDFIEATKKRLELAKNAANFKAIVVPLNTLEDVEALWALMNKTEPSH
jgi:hypothetical protein